ncbi:MAG: competence protein ComJ [Methyloglobulus sp.]
MKILSYFSYIDYGTVYVYDTTYYEEGEKPCFFKDVHGSQGFFAWPGMFVFFIITDNSPIHIDVFINEQAHFDERTIRAIQVPFKVIGDEGMVVEPLMGESRSLAIPKGEYALVFEQSYMNKWTEADMELDSTDPLFLAYKETWDVPKMKAEFAEADGVGIDEVYLMPMVMSRIWITPASNVEAKILVQDMGANSNYPLNPVHPLVIDEPPKNILKR